MSSFGFHRMPLPSSCARGATDAASSGVTFIAFMLLMRAVSYLISDPEKKL